MQYTQWLKYNFKDGGTVQISGPHKGPLILYWAPRTPERFLPKSTGPGTAFRCVPAYFNHCLHILSSELLSFSIFTACKEQLFLKSLMALQVSENVG